jgi:hypothetical protein
MSVSSAELANTTEAVTPVQEDAVSAPVLITTAQVLFDTAAARGGRRDKTGGRFGMLRRFFPTSTSTSIDASHPRPHDAPRRYSFIESALMEREMGRL